MNSAIVPLHFLGLTLIAIGSIQHGSCLNFHEGAQAPEWDLHVSNRRILQFQLPNIRHRIPPKKYLAAHSAVTEPDVRQAFPRDETHALRRRCAVAKGSWCGQYWRQEPVHSKPVPRGSQDCPNDCSGWGNCNYDTGICDCPAGRGGADCSEEVKRPCSNRYRHTDEHDKPAVGHLGPDKHDLNVKDHGWLAGRCYGYCHDDLALCFCGFNSTYRHIPAPPGSPPWTPPVQWGRPMADSCMIGIDHDGSRVEWGLPHVKYDEVYGPNGWCNSPNPTRHCGCVWDGNGGDCNGTLRYEAFCINQCTGHGDCHMGFCRCHPGWYGQDCSRKRAGQEMETGFLNRKWIKETAQVPPAALPEPIRPVRARPLIYVYDMPPAYTSRMLQYRIAADACMWRRFTDGNETYVLSMTYSIESYLHEMLLQSEHRTFDPEEADFFYVPMYITCYMWPVLGWADHPWWHAPYAHNRPMHVSNMIMEAYEWLSSNFPWWKRRGGRDHIWLMAPDEGACYMPTVVYNSSIILTHWGRMDPNHTSNSAYDQDNYSANMPFEDFTDWKRFDWQAGSLGHPCYNPRKDLVIPAFKSPEHFQQSPLLGAAPLERDILLYFRGDVGHSRFPRYSRGIRQRLFHLAHGNDWAGQHRIYIGTGSTIEGSYSEHMARSKFCLVVPGDGWSARAEDAVLHGCVPLVVMDEVHAVWEGILDWEAFSVRIRESALEAVPQILTAIPPERLAKMQRNLARVWHRFAYATGSLLHERYRQLVDRNQAHTPRSVMAASLELPPQRSPFRPVTRFPVEDDALSTIMQWLYHRINETR